MMAAPIPIPSSPMPTKTHGDSSFSAIAET
jgi:hypothetical protein